VSSQADDGSTGAAADAADAPAGDAEAPHSSRAALVEALEVRRHARRAVAFAAVFAVAVAVFFVVVVSGGQTDFPLAYYPLLTFVVFVTSGMLALAILVGRRVLRLAVHPGSIVRWSATGGLVAGLAWLAAAVGLALGPGQPWATLADAATPWAALLSPLGVWAVHTRVKRTARLRPVVAAAGLAALGGALVVANIVAFDLLALLGDVGRPVDVGVARLFLVGALALVGGETLVALLATLGGGPDEALLAVGVAPPVGLAAVVALGPGRTALVALAAGLGVGWTVACRRLRHVPDDAVPANPDPAFEPAD